MEEKTFKAICDVLRDKYRFDSLELVEFIMAYEKKTGEKIPDNWLPLPSGTTETVKIK